MNRYQVAMDRSTIKSIFDGLVELEIKHALFERQIGGVFFWKLIRFNVFLELATRSGLYDEPHPIRRKRKPDWLALAKEQFAYMFLCGARLGRYTCNKLLFSHPRKVEFQGQYIDANSYYLEQRWRDLGTSFDVIEGRYFGKHVRKCGENIKYGEPVFLVEYIDKKILSRFFFTKWNSWREEAANVVRELSAVHGFAADSLNSLAPDFIASAISRFSCRRRYYLKLLKKRRPDQIYLLIGYGMESLVAAARELGVETIEIQHGAISPYHTGYSFPGSKSIPYFPDKLVVWGRYWRDVVATPIDQQDVEVNGYPFMRQQRAMYASEERDPRRVLLLSQGTIAEDVQEIAAELAKRCPEFDIVLRLHPSEVAADEKSEGIRSDAHAERSVFLEFSSEMPLYQSLARSAIVIGVSSTAVIEAIGMGCGVLLVDLPGVESYDYLYTRGLVALVRDAQALEACIKHGVKVLDCDELGLFG